MEIYKITSEKIDYMSDSSFTSFIPQAWDVGKLEPASDESSETVSNIPIETIKPDITCETPRRPQRVNVNLLTEEEQRIKVETRRKKNRESAARCRKRQKDKIVALCEEVDNLTASLQSKEVDIKSLRDQKEYLEFILSWPLEIYEKL